MTFGPVAFLSPWLLAALLALPVIYWLLRAVPPRPAQIEFPPTRILVGLANSEKTSDKTPWWLTLIRLLAATLVILALAEPILNPSKATTITGSGPVVIFADNGWTSAARWPAFKSAIDKVIDEADQAHRSVVVLGTTTPGKAWTAKIEAPQDARSSAAALAPQPFAPDRRQAASALRTELNAAGAKDPSIVWISDGVDHKKAASETAKDLLDIAGQGSLSILDGNAGGSALGLAARSGEKGKLEAVIKRASGAAHDGTILALSARSERLGEAAFKFADGETTASANFELPLELRNQVVRLELANEHSAGAVSLIDAATQWHRVGLISGETREQAQPLLAPLYYIEKALQPYADLAVAKDSNFANGLETVLKQNISVLMLADIGTVTGTAFEQADNFVKRGGALIRFAGPRLEKGGDDLLPSVLRAGGRSLGGALSWSTPQALAPFDEASPFAGLPIPPDVKINRQVLADPALLTPEVEIWARLQDGTPLVTATKHGEGKLVLFHITANSDWSNLPISGLFVDMLRRLATIGRIGAGGDGSSTQAAGETDQTSGQSILPPLKTLDGLGVLKAAPPTAEPVRSADLATIEPSLEHPPGYYGGGGSPRALNVMTEKSTLLPVIGLPDRIQRLSFDNAGSTMLKPWLLATGLLLLLVDILAVLALQNGFGGLLRRRAATAAVILAALFAVHPIPTAFAGGAKAGAELPADVAQTIKSTGKVTFGYVLSGDRVTDETSRLGLLGLARVLEARTAVEPGEPAGIDISKDEIAFYPVIYWPVPESASDLPDAAVAKIDAYMKQGGLIVFDTRDYGQSGVNALPLAGKGGNALQRLLGRLDVPRLEPVPESHVVTKSFYILHGFPGRWDGGQLWVEAVSPESVQTNRARVSDGVTSIMITSNDFAAAWALDDSGRPLYQVVPGGEIQREMAFRSGVNIVMHALTGNYKADQVHVPALLERLGQ